MLDKKIIITFNTCIEDKNEFKKYNPGDEYVEFEKSIVWEEFKNKVQCLLDNFSYFNIYDLEIKTEKENGE